VPNGEQSAMWKFDDTLQQKEFNATGRNCGKGMWSFDVYNKATDNNQMKLITSEKVKVVLYKLNIIYFLCRYYWTVSVQLHCLLAMICDHGLLVESVFYVYLAVAGRVDNYPNK